MTAVGATSGDLCVPCGVGVPCYDHDRNMQAPPSPRPVGMTFEQAIGALDAEVVPWPHAREPRTVALREEA